MPRRRFVRLGGMKHFLALALLACPAFAGSHLFAHNGNHIATLDAAPPGATALRLRITNAEVDFLTGYENTSTSALATVEVEPTHGYTVRCNGVDLASDRVVGSTWLQNFGLYDGVADFGGTSGGQFAETKIKTNDTAWGTYTFTTAPTTIVLSRRTLYDYIQAPPWGANLVQTESDISVEWEWL